MTERILDDKEIDSLLNKNSKIKSDIKRYDSKIGEILAKKNLKKKDLKQIRKYEKQITNLEEKHTKLFEEFSKFV